MSSGDCLARRRRFSQCRDIPYTKNGQACHLSWPSKVDFLFCRNLEGIFLWVGAVFFLCRGRKIGFSPLTYCDWTGYKEIKSSRIGLAENPSTQGG